MNDPHKQIVGAVMKHLKGRKGFDAWWYSIDAFTRTEIYQSLEAIVAPMMLVALAPPPPNPNQLTLF